MDFIDEIGGCAIKAYRALGKVLPSVCIGMACVESAYGKAGSAKFNSYFGQKVGSGKTATKYWSGKFFTSKTKEEYTIGVHTTINAAFRAYDSMEQCVFNFYELLNSKLYARVMPGVDYKTQMQQIKLCGYMTSSTEVNSVIKIIEKYNLTQFDKVDEVPDNRNPYPVPTKNVRYNSRGKDVRWLQVELNRRGYRLKVDGIAGAATITALVEFQEQAFPDDKSQWDGICGQKTRNALIV